MTNSVLHEHKRNSEARLAELGGFAPDHLPLIEDVPEIAPRRACDVAGRACAISYLIGLAYGADPKELKGYLTDYSLEEWITPRERTLLDASELSEQERIDISWLSEAVQALAWALQLADLDCRAPCDSDLATRFPAPRTNPSTFLADARLRPIAEVQAEVDFHYRLHWWVRDCELSGRECEIESSVVVERRRALDWIYGVDPDWDEITLDT